ncbi:MAG: hypothetical protein MK135_01940 [Polyangiaceae bacterium]|nr:hypothetical protein [Polyangiaceae bacterium]
MAKSSGKTIICASCGFKNTAPLANHRCVSCGAPVDDVGGEVALAEEDRRSQQQTFNPKWFLIAIVVMALLTTVIVFLLPRVAPLFDFEGSAGMMVAIPVWFVGGALVGLMSPGRTFLEPVAAVFLVALPTAFVLFTGQVVKTMPAFLYVLFCALGILFTLVGSYAGERIQMGPPPQPRE